MRFFSFETALTLDEITERCMPYTETEQHSAWNVFDEYTSSRTGLHLYWTANGFTGYYENGERNRTYSLQRAKTWVSVKIKEKNGKRIIEGYTYFCPLLTIALLLGGITILLATDILAFFLLFVICSVLFISTHKEENTVIQWIKN